MKKLVLVLVSAVLLAACSSQEQPQVQQDFPLCTINGHDCWEVVQMVHNAKYKSAENATNGLSLDNTPPWEQYESVELENIGLSIKKAHFFDDGGSSLYVLSNDIQIYTNESMKKPNPQRGFTTITWPNGQQFVFNEKGLPVSHTPANTENN